MEIQNENDDMAIPKPLMIRNFPCPLFDVKNIEATLDYLPKDGDIIFCSYPKTGTTWMQYIFWQILHQEETLPSLEEMTYENVPFMEMAGTEVIDTLTTPRCYKTHFPYNMLKINKNAKYIYIHRNPMDGVVSYYHFMMNIYDRAFEFEDFYEHFISGNIGYGDYFDHVLSFDLHKDDPHLQIFSYEDLHRDKKEQVLRLAKIIGNEYYQTLSKDETRLQRILDTTTFSYMKYHLDTNLSIANKSNAKKHVNMFRKGVVGEGQNVLSADQIYRVQQKVLTKMKGTNYVQLWSLKQQIDTASREKNLM